MVLKALGQKTLLKITPSTLEKPMGNINVGDEKDSFEVMINPASYNHGFTIKAVQQKILGAPGTESKFVAVFPEGIKGIGKLYKERYKLQRFGRGGFIKLALRTRSPIVPVAIIGAEETHPMLAKVTWFAKSIGIPYVPVTPTFPLLGPAGLMPLPAKWTVRFGKAIDLASKYGPEAADDRILVNKLTSSVREQIQEMVDQSLTERNSIFGR